MELPNPTRWDEINAVLAEVHAQPAPDREDVLRDACGDDDMLREAVETLLDADATYGALLDEGAAALARPFLTPSEKVPSEEAAAPLEAGRRVGAYRLVERIGEGGTSVVYRAQRADDQFDRTVAIKVLRGVLGREEDTRERFQAERQILASLSHPHLAEIYDGGVLLDGRPYLVMEYVDGRPLTEHCRIEDCSLEERLTLFWQAAEAVQAAHEKLVVHRDLKPSNVLVERGTGQVKLLDFGIAKMLGELPGSAAPSTRTGRQPMTPAYAAPEQVKGEAISVATDTYALGVLLYELLTGERPYGGDEASPYAVARAVCEEDPPRPSAVVEEADRRSALQGDLDAIITTALRKTPAERYDTVDDLLDDLDRYRADRPVRAQRDGWTYRTRKFVRRNWGAIATIACAIILLASVSIYHTWRLSAERDRARREAETAEQVSDFLVDLFEASGPRRAQGDSTTAGALLRRGIRQADELDDQPQVQARMFDVIGDVYQNRGQHEEADSLYRQALSVKRQADLDRAEIVASLSDLGYEAWYRQRYDQADSLLRKAIRMDSISQSLSRSERAELFRRHSHVLRSADQSELAETRARSALRLFRTAYDGPHPKTAQALNTLAMTFHGRGNLEQAQKMYRETLAMQKKLLEAPHPDLADTHNNLMYVLHAQDKFAASEPRVRTILRMDTALYANDHPYVGLDYFRLGLTLKEQGKYEEALPHYRRAIKYRKKADKPAQTIVFSSYLGLGISLTALDRYARAEDAIKRAATLERRHRKNNTPGYGKPERRGLLEAFVSLYEAWDKPTMVSKYRDRLDQMESDTTNSSA